MKVKLVITKLPKDDLKLKKIQREMTTAYFKEKYIHKMIEKGLLDITIPEKTKSKHQRYYSITHQCLLKNIYNKQKIRTGVISGSDFL